MQKAAVQGYHVGDTVDVSARVHTMLEGMGAIDVLALVPCGGAGANLPLSRHPSILRRAIVTIATRGLPQDAADPHVARVCMETPRAAFSHGAKLLNDNDMENYAIANSQGDRVRLADLVKTDVVKFAPDLAHRRRHL